MVEDKQRAYREKVLAEVRAKEKKKKYIEI
jgi:hypothetical protein